VTAKRKDIFYCVYFQTGPLTNVKCLLYVFIYSICISFQNFPTGELIIIIIIIIITVIIIIKVKFTPEQATKAQSGNRGIAVFFL